MNDENTSEKHTSCLCGAVKIFAKTVSNKAGACHFHQSNHRNFKNDYKGFVAQFYADAFPVL